MTDTTVSQSPSDQPAAGQGDAVREIEILRRALAWHGDRARMATSREAWQQTIDEAISWVIANPEEGYPSFPLLSLATPPAPMESTDSPSVDGQTEAMVLLREARLFVADMDAQGSLHQVRLLERIDALIGSSAIRAQPKEGE